MTSSGGVRLHLGGNPGAVFTLSNCQLVTCLQIEPETNKPRAPLHLRHLDEVLVRGDAMGEPGGVPAPLAHFTGGPARHPGAAMRWRSVAYCSGAKLEAKIDESLEQPVSCSSLSLSAVSAGTPRSHKSRKRSSRPPWASARHGNARTRRTTGRHRSASSRSLSPARSSPRPSKKCFVLPILIDSDVSRIRRHT